jgi:hypothetical protein
MQDRSTDAGVRVTLNMLSLYTHTISKSGARNQYSVSFFRTGMAKLLTAVFYLGASYVHQIGCSTYLRKIREETKKKKKQFSG